MMVEMLRLPTFLLACATLRLGLSLLGFHAQFVWRPQLVFASPVQASAKAQEHADRGMQLAQSGDLKGAEAELRRAVDLAPGDPAYLASLGGILGMQQKLEESSGYFAKALEINPTDPASRRNLASNQFQLGQLQSARENLDRVLKARPADKTAILLRGMVAEELKDYSDAIKWLESVRDQVQERPKSIAALARCYYHTNRSQKAKQLLKSLQEHPSGAEGVFLGAQVAAELNDYDTAELLFASIQTTYSDTARLGYHLALVQYRSGHYEDSRKTLQRLIGSGQASSEAYNLLGWCYHQLNNLKEAVAAMDQAIDREVNNESNYVDLGMILVSHKRYAVALEAAKKAVEVAPSSYKAYMLKGLVEKRMNHLAESVKSYQRAVGLNPSASEAVLGLALAQSADGLTEEAAATFESGIKKFPSEPKLFQEYGRMLLNRWKGSNDAAESRAVALLDRAIALDASLAEPHYQLGNLALLKERPEEALRHLQVAARLDPKSSKIHFGLRRAYSRMGRSEEASKELELYNRLKAAESDSEVDAPADAKKTN
jgi:tetratricopeptide (TPR) repeat protein